MYIDLKIIYFILATLGCIALIYIIITLSNLNKLIKNSNELVIDNKNNIRNSLLKLPEVISNFNDVSENMKDITEVATDVTADFIVTKENMKSNIEVVTYFLKIFHISLPKTFWFSGKPALFLQRNLQGTSQYQHG